MRRILIALALAALTTGPAVAETAPAAEDAPSPYVVLEENADIPFSGTRVRGFRVGKDGSLLLDAGRNWYRAELWPPCRSDLRFATAIGLKTNAADRFDRFSRVVVDGSVCPVRSVDRIEDPDAAPAQEGAEAAT